MSSIRCSPESHRRAAYGDGPTGAVGSGSLTRGILSSAGNVHVCVWLADIAFDYVATPVAARNLIFDCVEKCWCSVELIKEDCDGSTLPRLPNERLYLAR